MTGEISKKCGKPKVKDNGLILCERCCEYACQCPTEKRKKDRFRELNPCEREVLRLLVESHINLVSEIRMHGSTNEARLCAYLGQLEELEDEIAGDINK